MGLEETSAFNDRLANAISAELKALLGSVCVGDKIEIPPSHDLCFALELFLPRLLWGTYPDWEGESLDGIFVEHAVKSNDSELRMMGACILIRDQTLAPFFAEFLISQEENVILSCILRLGEPGDGELGISGPPCNSREATNYRMSLMDRLESIQWVFSFPRSMD